MVQQQQQSRLMSFTITIRYNKGVGYMQPLWYQKTEQFLDPMQGVVSILLVLIILVSIYFLLATKSATARTA